MDTKVGVRPQARASLRLNVPPDARYSRYVRDSVVGFAVAATVAQADVEEFVTAVAEALANAVEHSRAEGVIEVSCSIVGTNQLLATVVDNGIGFEAEHRAAEARLPEELDERGRGLPIMRRLTDTFTIHSAPGKGTSVTLGRYVRCDAATGTRVR